MIGHLSWHNYEMTRRMAKMILLGLNKINEEELPPYLECFKVFVSIEDEFQESRIEWILGNADLLITRTHRQVQLNNYDFDK